MKKNAFCEPMLLTIAEAHGESFLPPAPERTARPSRRQQHIRLRPGAILSIKIRMG